MVLRLADVARRIHLSGPRSSFLRQVSDAAMRVREHTEVERVYRERGEALWRAIVAYSGDREIANDAVAEAFSQAVRRGSELRDAERWIWTTAFRIAAGVLKDERHRRGDIVTRAPEDQTDMPDDTLLVVSLLHRLSPKQRAAVVLFYYADLPTRRIAQILGTTPATVRVHLTQGRCRLKALLEESDG
jgi:RNA polymerase sigma-70 factor, ECF subfamily